MTGNLLSGNLTGLKVVLPNEVIQFVNDKLSGDLYSGFKKLLSTLTPAQYNLRLFSFKISNISVSVSSVKMVLGYTLTELMSFSTSGLAVYLKFILLSKQLDKNVPVLLSCLELVVNT